MRKISDANRKAKASRAVQLPEGLKSSGSRFGHQITKKTTQGGTVQAATDRSRDISPSLGGQKGPQLHLSRPKSVTQLRIAQAALARRSRVTTF